MARFTKKQTLDELSTILLFEADHLLMGAGSEIAAHFIGFPAGEAGEYCHHEPLSDVDLSRFEITGSFDRGYDYAFQPSLLNTLLGHEVQNLDVFMQGTPRAGGIVSGGETHSFMTPAGLCQTVADTVMARWKLEWDPMGSGTHMFTARELALLADMTEGAVRNALADKSEAGLRAIPGTKNPVLVDHDEAWRWLNGRRGFIPTPDRPREDRFLLEHLHGIQSTKAFGELIARRLWDAFGSPDSAANVLGWPKDDIAAWIDGTAIFDQERAQSLARALDLDVPLFVGKALEVHLRRDLGEGGPS